MKPKIIDYAAMAHCCYGMDKKRKPKSGIKLCKEIHRDGSDLFIYENKTDIILAFQGSNQLSDWLDDFKFHQIWAKRVNLGVLGEKIHEGFWNNYSKLRSDIFTVIKKSKKRISICGHSLGGASALLCRADLLRNFYIDADTYTFGAPKVGNKKFYDFVLEENVLQFRNNRDIVTFVPFSGMKFWSPPRIRVSNGKSDWSGWAIFWNWKDHFSNKYYDAIKAAGTR